jgi:hypothetical protein
MKSNLIEQHYVLDHFMSKLDIDSGSIDRTGMLEEMETVEKSTLFGSVLDLSMC